MIDTLILTGSCPRCGKGTLTNDEDMFGVRIVCVMCGHNSDLGKLPLKVHNIKELVLVLFEIFSAIAIVPLAKFLVSK